MVKADLQRGQIKISGNIGVVCEEMEKLLRVFRGEFGEELCEIVIRASKLSEAEFKKYAAESMSKFKRDVNFDDIYKEIIGELDGKGGRK